MILPICGGVLVVVASFLAVAVVTLRWVFVSAIVLSYLFLTVELFLDDHFVCCTFHVFGAYHLESLVNCIAGHIVERFALAEQHFQDVSLLQFGELDFCFHKGHGAMFFCDVQYFCCHNLSLFGISVCLLLNDVLNRCVESMC